MQIVFVFCRTLSGTGLDPISQAGGGIAVVAYGFDLGEIDADQTAELLVGKPVRLAADMVGLYYSAVFKTQFMG
jgi:hypothetical protein